MCKNGDSERPSKTGNHGNMLSDSSVTNRDCRQPLNMISVLIFSQREWILKSRKAFNKTKYICMLHLSFQQLLAVEPPGLFRKIYASHENPLNKPDRDADTDADA